MCRLVFFSILTILGVSLAITGCGAPAPRQPDKEEQHIRNVVGLVGDYIRATKKGAHSIDDVKAWAIKEGKATEEDFISTRDKQPYGLAHGMGIMVFETQGKDGSCYVFQAGQFKHISADEAANL